jgi:hypothetical protein
MIEKCSPYVSSGDFAVNHHDRFVETQNGFPQSRGRVSDCREEKSIDSSLLKQSDSLDFLRRLATTIHDQKGVASAAQHLFKCLNYLTEERRHEVPDNVDNQAA